MRKKTLSFALILILAALTIGAVSSEGDNSDCDDCEGNACVLVETDTNKLELREAFADVFDNVDHPRLVGGTINTSQGLIGFEQSLRLSIADADVRQPIGVNIRMLSSRTPIKSI